MTDKYRILTSSGKLHTFERVHRNKDRSDIRIDIAVLPSLLQVLIDTLVAYLGEKSHIRHANLLLLETLLPVRLAYSLSITSQNNVKDSTP